MTRCDPRLSASVVNSTYGSPSARASGSNSRNPRVAYPRRRFHSTTEYPIWPRQCGGNSAVPRCHRKPIDPQKSPSHIHSENRGKRGTDEPSGRTMGEPLASRSTCAAMNDTKAAAPPHAHPPCGREGAESNRALRHVGQCVGVVPGRVHQRSRGGPSRWPAVRRSRQRAAARTITGICTAGCGGAMGLTPTPTTAASVRLVLAAN